MQKNLVVLILFILLPVFISAIIVTASSPEALEEFAVGEVVQIEFAADADISSVQVTYQHAGLIHNISWTQVPEGTRSYSVGWDTTGLEAGEYLLRTTAHPVGGGGGATDWITVLLSESPEPVDPDAAAVVTRNAPDYVYPGSLFTVTFGVRPQRDFTGIIIRDVIPEGLELNDNPIRPLGLEWDFVEETRTLKLILKDPTAVEAQSVRYYARMDADLLAETVLPLEGDWMVLEETGTTRGKDSIRVGGVLLPECPTDEELLQYIDRWARRDLDPREAENDNIMHDIIERWANC